MAAKKQEPKKPQMGTMPPKIFAQASPKSIGGVSMFDAMSGINAGTVSGFQSERSNIDKSVNQLHEAGFEVLQVNNYTINFAGSQGLFEKTFNTKLTIEQRSVIKPGGVKDFGEFIECPDTHIPGLITTAGTSFENLIEGIAIEEPRYLMGPSMFPPLKAYWHLDVPAGISLALNADKAHRAGITGKGIRVAMVDSGHYAHPFFSGRGYRVAPVVLGPGAADPLKDESGHGTAESAKMNFANTIGSFNTAVALNPDIITCSWGSSNPNGPLSAADQALAAAIASAWLSGIVVIFSAGNGHYGFPGQHPDCISAGGVFMAQNESIRASDYASGFLSRIYNGRRVPDVCGLVGMRPKAAYLMLPLEPGDDIDVSCQGGVHPNGDETTGNDGWASISGTSAAAPQLAGLSALILEACSRLTPANVRDIMQKTARDVIAGNCNPACGGAQAVVGPDTATGYGLVDANKAVLLAKVRCLSVRGPVRGPSRSVPGPVQPVVYPEPIRQVPEPRPPMPEPGPITPVQPRGEYYTALQDTSLNAGGSAKGLSQDDINTLEDMIIKSDLDLD
jgi:hypothetical protein